MASLSMENKMAGGALRRAGNYGWDGLFCLVLINVEVS